MTESFGEDWLASLRHIKVLRPERLVGRRPNSLTIVGGMGAGKSTVAAAIASDDLTAGRYELARRVTTRSVRLDDGEEPTDFVTWDEFAELRKAGALPLSWVRPLTDGSSIGYGCRPASDSKLGLWLAGHGVYTNRASVQPPDALQDSLLLGVSAPDEVRAERVRERSPDITGDRLRVLMTHDEERMLAEVDVLVCNFGAPRPVVMREVVAFADAVADGAT